MLLREAKLMRMNWKSAKYSKIKIHAKYSRSAEINTKSSKIHRGFPPRDLSFDCLDCLDIGLPSLPGDFVENQCMQVLYEVYLLKQATESWH